MRPYDTVLYEASQGRVRNSNKILINYGIGVAVITNIASGVIEGIETAVVPNDSQIASPAEMIPAISGSLP